MSGFLLLNLNTPEGACVSSHRIEAIRAATTAEA